MHNVRTLPCTRKQIIATSSNYVERLSMSSLDNNKLLYLGLPEAQGIALLRGQEVCYAKERLYAFHLLLMVSMRGISCVNILAYTQQRKQINNFWSICIFGMYVFGRPTNVFVILVITWAQMKNFNQIQEIKMYYIFEPIFIYVKPIVLTILRLILYTL